MPDPAGAKWAASVALAVVSVAGGFVPYLGVYQILRLFVERRAGLEGILLWCGVCLAGYARQGGGLCPVHHAGPMYPPIPFWRAFASRWQISS